MRQNTTARWLAATALAAGLAVLAPGLAQAQAKGAPTASGAKEQFFPLLVYRTGPYAPNGVPFANGMADYYKMLNARDGGIGGVRLTMEECETGYATDRGVECYERLKGKGPTGAAYFSPLSTGITFALTEKAPGDKTPLLTMGYGRADSRNGEVFTWNFPLMGTYWTAASVAIQHIAKEWGGFDKLKGKKIALVYHDSPYGKEPIPALDAMSKKYGYEFLPIPVPAPGSEQKSHCCPLDNFETLAIEKMNQYGNGGSATQCGQCSEGSFKQNSKEWKSQGRIHRTSLLGVTQ